MVYALLDTEHSAMELFDGSLFDARLGPDGGREPRRRFFLLFFRDDRPHPGPRGDHRRRGMDRRALGRRGAGRQHRGDLGAGGGWPDGRAFSAYQGRQAELLRDIADRRRAGLRLRVKHFNADFTAWEDKAGWHSFEPVSAAPDRLSFRGLRFERAGEQLTITVTFKNKDGTRYEEALKLRRAPL